MSITIATISSKDMMPDRGEGIMSFDEMVAIVFGGVDFVDSTTNM